MNLKTLIDTYFQVRVTHIHAITYKQELTYERICASLLRVLYARISRLIAIFSSVYTIDFLFAAMLIIFKEPYFPAALKAIKTKQSVI